MSIHCEVKGSIKGINLSVRKAIQYCFDDFTITTCDNVGNYIEFSFVGDGQDAVDNLERFFNNLKEYSAKYDLETNIRWCN